MLSLDDYFRNRDEMNKEDWESPKALDISLFENTVSVLLEGGEVHLPHFNFMRLILRLHTSFQVINA